MLVFVFNMFAVQPVPNQNYCLRLRISPSTIAMNFTNKFLLIIIFGETCIKDCICMWWVKNHRHNCTIS